MAEKSVEIKIGADASAARQGIDEVGASLSGVGARAREAADATERAGGLINNTSRSIKGGIDSISTQLESAKQGLLAFLGVQQGLSGARDIADLADQYGNLRARIANVVGEGKELPAAMEAVHATALRTHADLAETGNLFARMVRIAKESGLATQEAIGYAQGLTQTVNQAVALSGASSEASKAAVTQLVQALQSGALRGDEFNSVMEQSPRLAQALADGLGRTTGELRKMAEQGQLSSQVVTSALEKQAGTIAQEFERLPPTVGRAMQDLHTQFMLYVADTDAANGYSEKAAKAIGVLAQHIGTVADALLHAGQTFGAWKALGFAQEWLAARLAVEQSTGAMERNGAASAASAATATARGAAERQVAQATQEHTAAAQGNTAALGANALASRAATAAIVAQRMALEASRTQLPDNAKAWGDVAAAMGGGAEKARAAGEAGREGARSAGVFATAVAGLTRALGPLLALDVGLNFKRYGTWIGEAAARLAGYKDRSDEVAAADRTALEIAANSAQMRRRMAAETQAAVDKQFELGKAGAEAVAKFDELTKSGKSSGDALKEASGAFDLSKIEGIRGFAAMLDKLGADGKLSAGEVQAAWANALKGEDLAAFETKARAAFAGSSREAERLAQMTDETLREALRRTGLDFGLLTSGMGAAARSAINDVEVMIGGLDRLKASGVDTSRALSASLSKAIAAADSERALEAVRAQVERVRAALGDKVADGLLQQAADKARGLKDALDAALPGINSVGEAMRTLGLKSRDELDATAKKAQEAYGVIKTAGQQEGESYEAWQARKTAAARAMIDAMVQANGGVVNEAIRARAAVEGIDLAMARAGETAQRAIGGAAAGAMREFAGATDQANQKLLEQIRLNDQAKYGRPGEGAKPPKPGDKQDDYDPGYGSPYSRPGEDPRNGLGETKAEYDRRQALKGQNAVDNTLFYTLVRKLESGTLTEADRALVDAVKAANDQNLQLMRDASPGLLSTDFVRSIQEQQVQIARMVDVLNAQRQTAPAQAPALAQAAPASPPPAVMQPTPMQRPSAPAYAPAAPSDGLSSRSVTVHVNVGGERASVRTDEADARRLVQVLQSLSSRSSI